MIMAAASLIILLFNSRSSPLYPDNSWVDAQAFYTMGRGWMHGLIPYRDLFEQKGPLLYLLFGLGYLLNPGGFAGIFFFEWLCFMIAGYWMYRCCSRFLTMTPSIMASVCCMILITSIRSFANGASAEEFLFPCFFYSLYCMIDQLQNHAISSKRLFLNGLMAGIVLVVKFNLLGFWFAWMAVTFFGFCLRREVWQGFKACFVFLAGMFLPLLLFVIYFAAAGGLKEFIDSYFLFNVGSYTNSQAAIPFSERLTVMFNTMAQSCLENPKTTALLLAGVFWLLALYPLIGLCMMILFLFTCLGVYYGGLYFWYYFSFPALFSLFGCLAVLWCCETLLKNTAHISLRARRLLYTLALIPLFAFGLHTSLNAFSEIFLMPESERWYTPMVEYMNQYQPHTVLNYNCLDTGIYNYMDQDPFMRYFMKQNVSHDAYPELMDSQWQAVDAGIPEFLVSWYSIALPDDPFASDPHVQNNYYEVMRVTQDGNIYVLYARNDLSPLG